MRYTWITVAYIGADNEAICAAICDECGADVTYEAEEGESHTCGK